MNSPFKIKQLIFAEHGFFFEIENVLDKEIYRCTPSRLFGDEIMLSKFSPKDICLIGYYAAHEERDAERTFFQNEKQKVLLSSVIG